MYLITYVDRVNISTAADSIKRELALSNTQLGFLQSAFGYPVPDLPDLRRLDRRSLRPAADAVPVRPDLGDGDDPHRLCRRPRCRCSSAVCWSASAKARRSRWRRARCRAGRRSAAAGFAQGLTHAFARLGNAITPPIVAWLIVAGRVARIVHRARLLQPGVGGDLALVLPRRPGRASGDHARGARHAAESGRAGEDRRGRRCRGRALTSAHGAGDDRLLLLRLDAVALPDVAAVVLPARVPVRPAEVGAVHVGGVLRRRGRRLSRRRDQRPHPASHRRPAAGAPQRGDDRLSRLVRLPGAGLPHARSRVDHRVARRARSSSPSS